MKANLNILEILHKEWVGKEIDFVGRMEGDNLYSYLPNKLPNLQESPNMTGIICNVGIDDEYNTNVIYVVIETKVGNKKIYTSLNI